MPNLRDLDPGQSPVHYFGNEVRLARTAAGMSQAELGEVIGYDATLVAKVEAGTRMASRQFAGGCDTAFPDRRGWFTRFHDTYSKWDGAFPDWFTDWVDAEQRATVIRWWEPLLIPGLLQTEEYARTLFETWQPVTGVDDIATLVAGRLSRQEIFTRADSPSLRAVIDEQVLHRCVGSVKIMRSQLLHLASMASRPFISVHVIPAVAGAHVGLLGAFAIASIADDRNGIVYMEAPDNGRASRDTAAAAKLSLTFDALLSEALPGAASRELITKAANEEWTI